MNIRNVRFRLTVWYSLSFFIATFVIFSTFYLVTRQALFDQVDTTLSSHGNKVVEVITRSGQEMHQTMAKQAFLSEFSEIPGMLLVVTNDSGKILSNSSNIDSSNKVFTQLFELVREKNISLFTNQKLDGISMRFYASPIHLNDKFVGSVLIGHPTDVIEKSLTNLQVLLGVVFVVFIIPTIIGGSLLARGATAPIADMSSRLKKITSENLEERVENPRTGDELEELSASFNNLLDRLSESFKRERQFIGDVAHELKTPLATQRSTMEVVLAKERTSKEYKRAIADLLLDNHKIVSTLKNILDLAWSEADSIKIQKEKVDLSEVLTEIYDVAQKISHKKNIRLEGKIAPEIYILGKREKIERAVFNIIDNAVKYIHANGKIEVFLKKQGDKAEIQIKDNGVGIAPKDLPHIFERFYRGAKTDDMLGSGLGLAIAKGIITAHHGNIKVKSKPGKGTEVSISLPIMKISS